METLLNILIVIVIIVFVNILLYGAFAFITLEINPLSWSEAYRLVFTILDLFFIIVLTAVIIS